MSAPTETRVVLRRWPAAQGGGVIALMPDMDEGRGRIGSYEHVGQHGPASRDVVGRTRPAHPADADAQALVRELRGMGYNVRVLHRMPSC